MKLTREEALKLHRQMWTDMQEKLGDCPSGYEREKYKSEWCVSHFPNEVIMANCFLCEYVGRNDNRCSCCPINWGGVGCVRGRVTYGSSPISEILALPERGVTK